jgi:hypothetical protein
MWHIAFITELASCRMRVATFDISRMSTTVRRHEALLRYARYLFIFNVAVFLWAAIPQLAQVSSLRGLSELIVSPGWRFAFLVLGSVGATYLILAHRLWWVYAVIFWRRSATSFSYRHPISRSFSSPF